jgi:hypothetical protein
MKKTANEWYKYHSKKNYSYRTLFWRFEEERAKDKITEQEYIDYYIHPNNRWNKQIK